MGMPCPACHHDSGYDRVKDTRAAPDNSIRRRYRCGACGHFWTTYERVSVDPVPSGFPGCTAVGGGGWRAMVVGARYRLTGRAGLFPWGRAWHAVGPADVLVWEAGGTFAMPGCVNQNYRGRDCSRWTGAERLGANPPHDRGVRVPPERVEGIEPAAPVEW